MKREVDFVQGATLLKGFFNWGIKRQAYRRGGGEVDKRKRRLVRVRRTFFRRKEAGGGGTQWIPEILQQSTPDVASVGGENTNKVRNLV